MVIFYVIFGLKKLSLSFEKHKGGSLLVFVYQNTMERSNRVYQPSKTTSKNRPTIWLPPIKIRYTKY
jgi:hypothetical protein